MHTIQLQLQDDVYEDIKKRNINIQAKFREFLFNMMDDGYPAISSDEAKKRVSKAVDEYYSASGEFVNSDDYEDQMNEFTKSL